MLTIYDPETTQSEYITTTPEHPFYLAGNVDNTARPKPEYHGELSNKWVGAGHLKTGDKLRQADGTLGEVRYVNTITQTRTMYNLSVQEAHTFFVGSHSWLVHNISLKRPCELGELVDLTDFRGDHILNRHKAGKGVSGKREFPSSWDDNLILNYVSDVATDPKALRGVGKYNSPYAIAKRDGIEVRVDFYPNFKPNGQPHPHAGKISTAYPINVPPNP